jgi:hypothetical protein
MTYPHRAQQQHVEIIVWCFALLDAQEHVYEERLHGGEELVGVEIGPLHSTSLESLSHM